jgi:hypothetical protein
MKFERLVPRTWSMVLVLVALGACTSGSPGPGTDGGASSSGSSSGTASSDGSSSGTTSSSSGSSSGSTGSSSGGTDGCRTRQECPNVESCVAEFDTVCGGAPPPQECSDDQGCQDAGGRSRCLTLCGSRCVPPCASNADCDGKLAPEACNLATGKCGPKPCAGDAECGSNIGCMAGFCERKACKSDAECQGACVNGKCASKPGECRPPAP